MQVVTQNCWSTCFLIAAWNLGHDLIFSLITRILVATSKSMSRPFLLPIQSQPHLSVSTVPFNFSIFGRDLTVLLCFGIYVTTSVPVASYVDLCCDHVFLTLQ